MESKLVLKIIEAIQFGLAVDKQTEHDIIAKFGEEWLIKSLSKWIKKAKKERKKTNVTNWRKSFPDLTEKSTKIQPDLGTRLEKELKSKPDNFDYYELLIATNYLVKNLNKSLISAINKLTN